MGVVPAWGESSLNFEGLSLEMGWPGSIVCYHYTHSHLNVDLHHQLHPQKDGLPRLIGVMFHSYVDVHHSPTWQHLWSEFLSLARQHSVTVPGLQQLVLLRHLGHLLAPIHLPVCRGGGSHMMTDFLVRGPGGWYSVLHFHECPDFLEYLKSLVLYHNLKRQDLNHNCSSHVSDLHCLVPPQYSQILSQVIFSATGGWNGLLSVMCLTADAPCPSLKMQVSFFPGYELVYPCYLLISAEKGRECTLSQYFSCHEVCI